MLLHWAFPEVANINLPQNELLSRFPSDEKAAELLSSDLLTQLNDLVQTNAVVLELLRAQKTKTEKACLPSNTV